MKQIWVTIVFTQAKSALIALKASKTIKLTKAEKSLLREVRDLIDALIG